MPETTIQYNYKNLSIMNNRRSILSHLAAFACGVVLVCGVSMTAPHRVASGVYGDVNGDGVVDVVDVNEVINVILGGHQGGTTEPVTYTVNGVSFTMVPVEGGTFTMGNTEDDDTIEGTASERPAHLVTLSSYAIGETEVTQALWEAVMGSNPSYFNGWHEEYDLKSRTYVDVNYGTNLQRPVESVSWDDCQAFITKLNQLTGEHFRLPTEAEWEYAARGGNKSQGYKYAGSNNLDDVAWYNNNAFEVGASDPNYGTHTVAMKLPNELGLYDMTGNVNEWCQDRYGRYSNDAQTNPTGPTSGNMYVFRGGGWYNEVETIRVTYRHRLFNDNHDFYLGLRLVL